MLDSVGELPGGQLAILDGHRGQSLETAGMAGDDLGEVLVEEAGPGCRAVSSQGVSLDVQPGGEHLQSDALLLHPLEAGFHPGEAPDGAQAGESFKLEGRSLLCVFDGDAESCAAAAGFFNEGFGNDVGVGVDG